MNKNDSEQPVLPPTLTIDGPLTPAVMGDSNRPKSEALVKVLSDKINEQFPKSLVNDRTKIGKQATLVQVYGTERLMLSLDNGILTLNPDQTWSWSER